MIGFSLEAHSLTLLVEKAQGTTPGMVRYLGLGIRDATEKVRARAVRNVSGYPVTFDGLTFRVNAQTGALKGAVETQWPYGGSPLQGRVFVNGAHTSTTNVGGYPSRPVPVGHYAGAIEFGHRAIDLKKTMQGKIVPFFGARAENARGPYTARGLKPVHALVKGIGGLGFGGSADETQVVGYSSEQLNRKLAEKGKRPMLFQRQRTRSGSAYFISFRRVGKTGWVIPEAKPRPFMAAALSQSRADAQRLLGARYKEGLLAP